MARFAPDEARDGWTGLVLERQGQALVLSSSGYGARAGRATGDRLAADGDGPRQTPSLSADGFAPSGSST